MLGAKNEVFECSVCGIPTQHTSIQESDDRLKYTAGVKLTKRKSGYSVADFPIASQMLSVAASQSSRMFVREIELENGNEIVCEVQRGHLIYKCVVCRQDTYFLVQYMRPSQASGRFDLPFAVLHKYPKKLFSAHEAIPANIRSYISECERCMDVRAFNAVAMTARLTVDELARSFSATGRDLNHRLEQLKIAGVLNEEIISMAHSVRQAGRNGAHAEWSDITEEQAHDTLYALQEILRELYVTPFERDQRKIKGLHTKK